MQKMISIQPVGPWGTISYKSCVFPVQRMGIDLLPINVAAHLAQTDGQANVTHQAIDRINMCYPLKEYHALTAGFVDKIETIQFISEIAKRLKALSQPTLFAYEMVMREPTLDTPSSISILENIRRYIIPNVDVLVLDIEELTYLSKHSVNSLSDAVHACHQLIEQGIKMVLLKDVVGLSENQISMVLALPNGEFLTQRPKIIFDVKPHFIGDLITAVFTACLIKEMSPVMALKHTNEAVYGVLQTTANNHCKDLDTINAQYEFVEPTYETSVVNLGR